MLSDFITWHVFLLLTLCGTYIDVLAVLEVLVLLVKVIVRVSTTTNPQYLYFASSGSRIAVKGISAGEITGTYMKLLIFMSQDDGPRRLRLDMMKRYCTYL